MNQSHKQMLYRVRIQETIQHEVTLRASSKEEAGNMALEKGGDVVTPHPPEATVISIKEMES